jgi:hypothetical protein
LAAPTPLVQKGGRWRFDSKAGPGNSLPPHRANELDAIEVCRGYVAAQHEYASEKHDGALVNQYAQRVISTPGKRDGLAWKAADGSWQGPVGEDIAGYIAEGTRSDTTLSRLLLQDSEGSRTAAPMGAMDFLVGGVMIGGFAMVAAPRTTE